MNDRDAEAEARDLVQLPGPEAGESGPYVDRAARACECGTTVDQVVRVTRTRGDAKRTTVEVFCPACLSRSLEAKGDEVRPLATIRPRDKVERIGRLRGGVFIEERGG